MNWGLLGTGRGRGTLDPPMQWHHLGHFPCQLLVNVLCELIELTLFVGFITPKFQFNEHSEITFTQNLLNLRTVASYKLLAGQIQSI